MKLKKYLKIASNFWLTQIIDITLKFNNKTLIITKRFSILVDYLILML